MCKALIIGAGGVGTVVAQKIAANPIFSDVMLASRTKAKCDAIAAAIGGDRVKTAQVDTDAQLTRRFGRKENGGFANCIPGLRQYLDYPHIASLACPKPMLFINGTKDKLFPVPG
ncbi:Saccharopine dehydrogenase, partial [human gut metagenome]